IVMWYLPGAMTNNAQKQMWDSLESLSDVLDKSIVGQNWWTKPDYFKPESLAGCLEFAPAIHQLGHSAWTDTPSVSAALKTKSGQTWASQMTFPSAMLSAALSIMHLPLYNAGLHGMEVLSSWAEQNDKGMDDTLDIWSTVYTNISMITNWGTPLHRDPHSQSNWYDILVSVGEYKDCYLNIPTLGLKLEYSPGTIVAFSGCLLRHGVNKVDGHRCCFAYYMRDNIHNFLCVPATEWMTVDMVRNALVSGPNKK
ncbi:hypothetical protein SCLCIDRAFT_142184, partial [Scleroderma citrinum Foug A]